MKKLSLLLLFCWVISAKAQDLAWVKEVVASGPNDAYGLAVDAQGNSYSTGRFLGNVDFDTGPGTSLLNAGIYYDIYVLKLDPNGDFLWARQLGGATDDEGFAIDVDDSGNVYTTGYFQGSADFDPSPSTFMLSGGGAFISKLDSMGNFVWATGGGFNGAVSIAVDATHAVYLASSFTGTMDFDPGASVHNLTSSGSQDIYICKFDPMGNFAWAHAIGGTAYDQGLDIDIDPFGDVVTVGYYLGNVDFNPGIDTFMLNSNSGSTDIFINKFDANGNFKWAKSFGGPNTDMCRTITTDAQGSIYSPIFKLDTAGNYIWNTGGIFSSVSGGEDAFSIAVDHYGNLYTTGNYGGVVDMDPNASVFLLYGINNGDIFIRKLDPNGNFVWAFGMGGNLYEYGYGIGVDTWGGVYTTGSFSGTVDFDPGPSSVLLFAQPASRSLYVHKYLPCSQSSSSSTESQIACDSYTWQGSTYSATGTYTHTIANAVGCDSVMTLNLTILNSTTSTETAAACDSFAWQGSSYYASGIYTSIIPNAAGCDSLMTLALTVTPVDTSVSVNASSLTANTVGAAYQWIDCNSGFLTISGATNQTFVAMNSGNFAVIVTENGCTDTSACYSVTISGLSDIQDDFQCEIVPNPFSHSTYLHLNRPLQNADIILFNHLGQRVMEMNHINEEAILLQRKRLVAGHYYLRIMENDQILATRKILIFD